MATEKFGTASHTIYRGADFYRSSGSELPNVMCAAHESRNDDGYFNPGETLTLTLSDGTQCPGWTYMGMTKAIKGGTYIVVTKGICTYVLGTGDTNTLGNVDCDEMEAPPKTLELNICKIPYYIAHFV